MNDKSIFETLYAIDVNEKIKEKAGLRYLPWSSAWAIVKKYYPNANYKVIPQQFELGNTRPWHDDGKSGWVDVSVTINDITITETLPIMDYRNKSIPADKIESTDANKSIKRCLVKCLALFGLAMFVFEGEDLPEEASRGIELKDKIKDLVSKKCALSDKAKAKVAELCKDAEKQANPNLGDDLITGNYNNIEDVDILTNLEKQLLAVRK